MTMMMMWWRWWWRRRACARECARMCVCVWRHPPSSCRLVLTISHAAANEQRTNGSSNQAKDTGAAPDFSMLDRIISFANIANDECDYGQALKLGLDLYSHADVFDNDALALLAPTYRLLQR